MKIEGFFRFIVLWIIVAFFLGCTSVGMKTHEAEEEDYGSSTPESESQPLSYLPLASEFKLKDVPIPEGFSLNRKESFIFQDAQLRVGRLIYEGREDYTELAHFFSLEMPKRGWKLRNKVEYEHITLNFEKQKEFCTIILGTMALRKSRAEIFFGPLRSTGPAEQKSFEQEIIEEME